MTDTQGERPDTPTPHSDAEQVAAAPTVPPVPPVPSQPAGGWQQPAATPRYQPPQGYPTPSSTETGPTSPIAPLGAAPATGTIPTAAVTAPPRPRGKVGAGKVAGILVAAALVGGAAGLGGAYAGTALFAPEGTLPAAGPSAVTVNDSGSVNQTTAIAAKVVPSVVTIQASGSTGSGTGSGVVLTEDGYVVTNTHVVTLDGASGDATIRVTTSDGDVYDASIVGTDPTYDLAVIKLEGAEGMTPIEFASSSQLNVGDQTVAIGAPLGLSNTVTTGIVSALNRSIEIASSAVPDTGDEEDQSPQEQQQDSPFFFDFGQGQGQAQASETIKIAVIQTDAAINPGNSGGALVDDEGRLIGINVAIASAGGSSGAAGSIGVGFSIPSDIVQRITDDLIADGAATHGLLGASVQSAEYVEGSTMTGAYIAEVVEGGAAAAGGLQVGDIVTGFNGVPITDSVDLTAQVRAAAAGSDATVTFVRDGETRTIDVVLGDLGQ
ncbi:hypothetical protein GCM10022200_07990 [Microbacterium awajiense]|uniref:PDZ domain-containing protein n=1 Tax=Microbacterium awajiense TaxID=415214 RepID=A0ABP7AAM6_9MICO